MKARYILLSLVLAITLLAVSMPAAEAANPEDIGNRASISLNAEVSNQAKEILPDTIIEDVTSAISNVAQGDVYLILATEIPDGYDILVSVDSSKVNRTSTVDNQLKNFEVIVLGEKISVEKIEPRLVEQTITEEVIEQTICEACQSTEKEANTTSSLNNVISARIPDSLKVVDQAVKVTETSTYEINMQASERSASWYVAEEYIYAHNSMGWILWKLGAKGNFYINPGVAVLQVIDQSYTYCAWYSGYSVRNFTHYTVLGSGGSYGHVYASATFFQFPCTNWDAYAYITKYKNLYESGNANMTYRWSCDPFN